MNQLSKLFTEACKIVQTGLLLVALAVLFMPRARSSEVHSALTALLTAECFWLIFKAWRLRLLNMRSDEGVDRVLQSGRVTSGWLEPASLLAGFIAVLVLAL